MNVKYGAPIRTKKKDDFQNLPQGLNNFGTIP